MSEKKIDKQFLLKWFLENFEDPAEHTPYESREGGYIYIFGGPYNAREELENNFENIETSLLDSCVSELENISTEWAKIPDELDLINYTLEQRKIVSELTEEKIIQNAFEYVKSEKKTIRNLVFKYNNTNKKIIFMAGSPGAGKTEMSSGISTQLKIDSIEADKIRQYCPNYNGHNSHLFQRASSKAVNTLVDYAFKNDISFILDGNFANYKIQKENIERALKKDYEIEIRFVNIDIEDAKKYTIDREKTEGRRITDEIFREKFFNSISTVKKFFGIVNINLYDLSSNQVFKNITEIDFDKQLERNINKLNV